MQKQVRHAFLVPTLSLSLSLSSSSSSSSSAIIIIIIIIIRVEGGVHAIGMIVQLDFAELVRELVFYQVNEVGSIAGFHVERRDFQRSCFRAVSLLAGDGAGFNHGVEHQVAALQRALRILVRRQIVRALDHSGQQGGLGQGEVLDVLVEISVRGLGKAVDGEGAALSHVHLIGVHLKDALLGKLVFQLDGDQHFQQLALDRLLR